MTLFRVKHTNKFIPIHNIFFDKIFKLLKEGELRVLLAIIRWEYREISLNQLGDLTGMTKSSVARSLKTLIERGLVVKDKSGLIGQETCSYSIGYIQELEEGNL